MIAFVTLQFADGAEALVILDPDTTTPENIEQTVLALCQSTPGVEAAFCEGWEVAA